VIEPAGRDPLGTVLFSHGNAGNLANHLPFAEFLPMQGYRLVLYDYRGYGASSDWSPSRASTIEDCHSALDAVLATYGKPWLYGHSLGSSISLTVAAERREDVRGVVAVAPFTAYRDVARAALGHPGLASPVVWPLGFLVSRGNDPIEAVEKISPTPILFVHGTGDRIVPSKMSEKLYAAAREPKEILLIPDVGHNDDWRAMGPEFVERVLRFLQHSDRP
jgi:pimeloyl-ACP methyl ester carboxylesterase